MARRCVLRPGERQAGGESEHHVHQQRRCFDDFRSSGCAHHRGLGALRRRHNHRAHDSRIGSDQGAPGHLEEQRPSGAAPGGSGSRGVSQFSPLHLGGIRHPLLLYGTLLHGMAAGHHHQRDVPLRNDHGAGHTGGRRHRNRREHLDSLENGGERPLTRRR